MTRSCAYPVIRLLMALAIFLSVPSIAEACSVDDGKDFINNLGNEAISLASEAKQLDPTEREKELRRLLHRGFDLSTISRFVLGRYWRNASDADRSDYQSTFEEYLVKSYASRLLSYRSETFTITDASPGKKAGASDISTSIQRPEGAPISVLWRLNCRDNAPAIFDVVIEGVSMALAQRSEIASVIQQNGGKVRGLIDELNQKISAFN